MAFTVGRARGLAELLMADELPRRWCHVQSVGAAAERLGPTLGSDAELVACAAWLHDIGYARQLQDTGFHPLDGARYLRSISAGDRLCGLVAYHSGAMYEAELRGLRDELSEFPDERSLARDVVWFCDMTTSPAGDPVTFDERLGEIRRRYGDEHTVPRAIAAASGQIRAAVEAVCSPALAAGVNDPRFTVERLWSHSSSR
jgi:HD domain-containing protein